MIFKIVNPSIANAPVASIQSRSPDHESNRGKSLQPDPGAKIR